MFTREEVKNLAQIHSDVCISIYLPTHGKGMEVLEQEDRILLKNEIQKLRRKLPSHGLAPSEINAFLEPLVRLLDDVDFWHNQKQGLVILRSNGIFKKFRLPWSFSLSVNISTEFLLWPLLTLFMEDEYYYLVCLSLGGTDLYQGSQFSFEKISSPALDQLPPLKEAMGSDYQQKSLQFRTHHSAHGRASYHGHGEGKDDHLEEVRKYFIQVDQMLKEELPKDRRPVLMAGLDYLVSIYRDVSKLDRLVEPYISGNPRDHDQDWLHRQSWTTLYPQFHEVRAKKFQKFLDMVETDQTDYRIQDILPAAMEGKVDTLFILEDTEIWGTYDPIGNQMVVDARDHIPNVSLVNKAAIETFLKGGHVYVVSQDEMPLDFIQLGALYRY